MTPTDAPTTTTPHLWRSPLLGTARHVHLDGGELEYFERGEGPVLVFAHGWLANANLWRAWRRLRRSVGLRSGLGRPSHAPRSATVRGLGAGDMLARNPRGEDTRWQSG
jgi:pimeloyl-ACP methyl ester carboxylesterase